MRQMDEILFNPDLMPMVLSGDKTSTVRLGVRSCPMDRDIRVRPAVNRPDASNKRGLVRVLMIETMTIGEFIDTGKYRDYDYDSASEYMHMLEGVYGDVVYNLLTVISVIHFRLTGIIE